MLTYALGLCLFMSIIGVLCASHERQRRLRAEINASMAKHPAGGGRSHKLISGDSA
jgi:hypothetical protein